MVRTKCTLFYFILLNTGAIIKLRYLIIEVFELGLFWVTTIYVHVQIIMYKLYYTNWKFTH